MLASCFSLLLQNYSKELSKLFSLQAPDLIPFDNPQHIDNAKEEYEGYGSKIYSLYDGLHKKTSDVFQVMFEKYLACI